MTNSWSADVQRLLTRLSTGDDIAIPSVYPGSMSFNDHAVAYLNNAAALCRDRGMSDFRIFMALYGIRHGLELWLKCVLRNELMDRGLVCLSRLDSTFDHVAIVSRQYSKPRKAQLQIALCVFRNVCEDSLTFPECWERSIGDEWIDRAISFMRSTGRDLPRERFALLWHLPIDRHDIRPLWHEMRDWIECNHDNARFNASEAGIAAPSEIALLDSAVALFGALDESGDAFRYPNSMDGKWYTMMPHFSLQKLGELATELEDTVRAYDALYERAYEFSTVGNPLPHFDVI